MFGADDHNGLCRARPLQPLRENTKNRFGAGGPLLADSGIGIDADCGHRAAAGGKTALNVKRGPGSRFFVLRDAQAELAWPPESGFATAARISAPDVA